MMHASNYMTDTLIKRSFILNAHVQNRWYLKNHFSDDQFRNQGKNDSGHYFMSRHVQRLHHFSAAENSQQNQNKKTLYKIMQYEIWFLRYIKNMNKGSQLFYVINCIYHQMKIYHMRFGRLMVVKHGSSM